MSLDDATCPYGAEFLSFLSCIRFLCPYASLVISSWSRSSFPLFSDWFFRFISFCVGWFTHPAFLLFDLWRVFFFFVTCSVVVFPCCHQRSVGITFLVFYFIEIKYSFPSIRSSLPDITGPGYGRLFVQASLDTADRSIPIPSVIQPTWFTVVEPFWLPLQLRASHSCRCFPILDGLLLISSKYIRGPRVDITWSSYGRPLLRDSRLRVDIDPLDRVIQPTSFTAAGAIWHIPLWESHNWWRSWAIFVCSVSGYSDWPETIFCASPYRSVDPFSPYSHFHSYLRNHSKWS